MGNIAYNQAGYFVVLFVVSIFHQMFSTPTMLFHVLTHAAYIKIFVSVC